MLAAQRKADADYNEVMNQYNIDAALLKDDYRQGRTKQAAMAAELEKKADGFIDSHSSGDPGDDLRIEMASDWFNDALDGFLDLFRIAAKDGILEGLQTSRDLKLHNIEIQYQQDKADCEKKCESSGD